jgi:hypothetical protein
VNIDITDLRLRALAAVELLGNGPSPDFIEKGMALAGTNEEIMELGIGLMMNSDIMVEMIATLTNHTKEQVIASLRNAIIKNEGQ